MRGAGGVARPAECGGSTGCGGQLLLHHSEQHVAGQSAGQRLGPAPALRPRTQAASSKHRSDQHVLHCVLRHSSRHSAMHALHVSSFKAEAQFCVGWTENLQLPKGSENFICDTCACCCPL